MALRPEFAKIADWVSHGARVLDLGCGDGSLLHYLQTQRNIRGYGVEINDDKIFACLRHGVNVIQADLESGLQAFDSGSFDYVILSQTLQAMRQTEEVILEMLRIGQQAIVTFPNFAHWRHRWDILRGHMPVSKAIPYQWYNTPNIHFCTINDFELFCAQREIMVEERLVWQGQQLVNVWPNWLGTLAAYRLSRQL